MSLTNSKWLNIVVLGAHKIETKQVECLGVRESGAQRCILPIAAARPLTLGSRDAVNLILRTNIADGAPFFLTLSQPLSFSALA
jgi:hypothetical protein